jgi:hypothetical protein
LHGSCGRARWQAERLRPAPGHAVKDVPVRLLEDCALDADSRLAGGVHGYGF